MTMQIDPKIHKCLHCQFYVPQGEEIGLCAQRPPNVVLIDAETGTTANLWPVMQATQMCGAWMADPETAKKIGLRQMLGAQFQENMGGMKS